MVLVSSGTLTYPNLKNRQILDEFPDCGPLGGIYSALKASTTPLNLVVSCDIPFVKVAFLNYLIEKAEECKALITVPVDENGQLQMACAVYHKDTLPVMEQQLKLNALKLRNLAALLPLETINIQNGHPLYNQNTFKNVNTPEVLNEARELWKNL